MMALCTTTNGADDLAFYVALRVVPRRLDKRSGLALGRTDDSDVSLLFLFSPSFPPLLYLSSLSVGFFPLVERAISGWGGFWVKGMEVRGTGGK